MITVVKVLASVVCIMLSGGCAIAGPPQDVKQLALKEACQYANDHYLTKDGYNSKFSVSSSIDLKNRTVPAWKVEIEFRHVSGTQIFNGSVCIEIEKHGDSLRVIDRKLGLGP